jgi:hypothetical protein
MGNNVGGLFGIEMLYFFWGVFEWYLVLSLVNFLVVELIRCDQCDESNVLGT